MPDNHKVFLLARGSTTALDNYAGPEGEVVVDTTLSTLRVQNGNAGGVILAKKPEISVLGTRITELEDTSGSGGGSYEARIAALETKIAILNNAVKVRGCWLYRSSNGIATTIEAVQPDGTTPLKFEVIDALYRRHGFKFGAYNTNNPDLKPFTSLGNNTGWIIDGTGNGIDRTTALPASITMSSLVSLWGSTLAGLESAQVANNSWYTRYKDTTDSKNIQGVPAIAYCYALTNDGGGWLVPNIWELMIIFMLSDKLDEMDPTASPRPGLKLGYTATNGRFYFNVVNGAWSCTEHSNVNVRRVGPGGGIDGGARSDGRTTIPIRELAA